ncbi:MAG: 23S rRNA (cytidine1920-2'-O)/16S rRNA (cytidine1409-2'-O)-methyltransferase [Parcubacteria group bacterium Gr01-1014_33]|nr:MAG: 23S rRNA (cytidine1920-2'-O)/16S rRNA (cytidine1409-2'-O)-methyltransferase [Parcubacteria group bacterium Gr01-1014_33]
MKKKRLDVLLIEKKIVADKKETFILVTEGRVFLNGQKAISPAQMVGAEANVEVRENAKYVGRGAVKLEAALEKFRIDVNGKICADIGAATGGFTQALLERGAKTVYAVDTARGKLALKLREDPRIIVMEGTDIRHLEKLPELARYATIDVSLVSLQNVLAHVRRFLLPEGEVIALFKPQYETRDPKALVRGVIKDPRIREKLLHDFVEWAERNGWRIKEWMESPIRGSEGNTEYLLLLHC